MPNAIVALLFFSSSLVAAAYPLPDAADKAAPAFTAKDANGQVWSLKDAQAKPVLVDLWASWCRPCLEAMPDLNRFYQAHGARMGVLGLDIDSDGWKAAKPVIARYALKYPVAVIDPKLSKSFGAKGFPFLVVVYQGKIVKSLIGAHRLKDLEKELAPWL